MCALSNTSPHGYRVCVRTYLNGDGIGKGTPPPPPSACRGPPTDSAWPEGGPVSAALPSGDPYNTYMYVHEYVCCVLCAFKGHNIGNMHGLV